MKAIFSRFGKLGSFAIPEEHRRLVLGSAALWICGLLAFGVGSAFFPASKAGHADSAATHAAAGEERAHVEGPQEHSTESEHGHAPEVAAATAELRHEDPSTVLRIIELYHADGENVKAVPYVDRAMAMGLKEKDFLSQAAQIYLDAGEFQKAAAAAEEAMRQDDSPVLLHVAVMAGFRLGRVDSAMAACLQALKKFPDHAGLRLDLATMEIEMGPGHPEYGKTLKQAIAADPGNAALLYLVGRKHALEGNFGDAETAFRQVLEREPGHAKASAQLGIALFQQGKMAEAVERMIAALRQNPRDYNSWYNLGEWYLLALAKEENPEAAKRLRAKALQSYLRAVELNGEHAQAHYRIGVLMHGNAQYKEAIRHFEAALRVDSTHVSAWFQMGVAYQRLALADKARACLRRAFELDPLNRVVIAKLRELS